MFLEIWSMSFMVKSFSQSGAVGWLSADAVLQKVAPRGSLLFVRCIDCKTWSLGISSLLGKKLEILTPNFSLMIWSLSQSCSLRCSIILSRCLMLNSARCSLLLMSSCLRCSSCCCFFSRDWRSPTLVVFAVIFIFYCCSKISSFLFFVWFVRSCQSTDFFSWFSSI